jgi:dolichol-phosphate mannosyltransferase
LSIVIPALNEQEKIALTVDGLLPACRRYLPQFQLILVNDGSTDRTGEVMDELARRDSSIVVIHHPKNQGVGACYRDGIDRASLDYVTLIPGDNICRSDTWEPLFGAIGTADLVLAHRVNMSEARKWYRVVISHIYSKLLCTVYRMPITEIQAVCVYPARLAKEIRLQSTGFMYQLELLVQAFRCGCSFTETPLYMIYEGEDSSRSLRWRTVRDLLHIMWKLMWVKPLSNSWRDSKVATTPSDAQPSNAAHADSACSTTF